MMKYNDFQLTHTIYNSNDFIVPIVYGIAILIPFFTKFLFKKTSNSSIVNIHDKTIYANFKNLTSSNNKYYVGNYYHLQINFTELFEDLILTRDTYDFLSSNFTIDSTTINIEFDNEQFDKTLSDVNTLFKLIIKDLSINNLYILVTENTLSLKDYIDISSNKDITVVNVLDLYGYLNPKIRKICLMNKSTDDVKGVIFECDDTSEDILECSSIEDDDYEESEHNNCDRDDNEDDDEQTMSNLEKTIQTFRCLKKQYKNIYTIMKCI